jgi:DNA-binding HxlR family transcriptional regulator
MLPNTYEEQNCAIARSLEIIGERWTLLIVRDAMLGIRRFDDFQTRLGVSRAVLSNRLSQLVEHGVLQRVLYQEHPERHEYRLTEHGQALWPALAALAEWGGASLPGTPPRWFRHRSCRSFVHSQVVCPDCGQTLQPTDVVSGRTEGMAVSRAEHIAQPVVEALSRERGLLAPVRG